MQGHRRRRLLLCDVRSTRIGRQLVLCVTEVTKNYPWTRFWCPREARYAFDFSGFLEDPQGEHGKVLNPAARPLEAWTNTPCLILLGEPGIGKTDVLRRFQSAPEDATRLLQYVDLGIFGSTDHLLRGVFQSTWFDKWKRGEQKLELLLDGLDECRVHIAQVSKLIGSALADVPRERLILRIACRAVGWPETLTEGLEKLFGSDRVVVIELLPLRRVDVQVAAKANSIEYEPFLKQIREQEIQGLAMRPVTLDLLIKLLKAEGRLPASRLDLYKRAARVLCEDSPERNDNLPPPGTDPDQRVAMATRIAACLLLSGGTAISTGGEAARDDEGIFLVGDLVGV